MRPDEHKKKKNAEYKKKHGISAKKENKKEEIKKGKPEDIKISEENQENASKENETKSFSKRKVTSNWEKYEESEYATNDKVKGRRGENFTTLVERVGDSHSQFRFQAEKEWEEEDSSFQETHEVLKINFEDLSQSLNSLPLFKKLDLEETQITFDLPIQQKLGHDKRTTNNIQKAVDVQYEGLGNIDINQKEFYGTTHQTKKYLNSNILSSGPNIRMSKTEASHKTTSNLYQSMKELSSESSCANNMVSNKPSLRMNTKTDQDEELEFLLSLDTGHCENYLNKAFEEEVPNNPETGSLNPNVFVTSKAPGSLGDCIEHEIKATEINIQKAPGPQDINSEESFDIQKPKEDLENWLDSVLG